MDIIRSDRDWHPSNRTDGEGWMIIMRGHSN